MAYTIGRSALDNTPTPTRLGVPSIQDYLGNFQSQNDIWRQSWSPQFNTPYRTSLSVDPMADVQDSILNPNPTGNSMFGGWEGGDGGTGSPGGPVGDPSDPNNTNNNPFSNFTAPALANISNVTSAITSPFGNVVTAVMPFGTIAQLGARGVNAAINSLKTNTIMNKDTVPWSAITGVPNSGPTGDPNDDPANNDPEGTFGDDDPNAAPGPSEANVSGVTGDNSGPGSPGSSGADSGPGSPGSADPGGDGEGWAKGGWVNKSALFGRNPKGPDDGAGYLDDGEYVIRAKAAKKLHKMQPGLLDMLNQI
jgi:hypothetical protein